MSNKSRLLFILIYCLFAAALIVRKGELLLLATPLLVYLIIGALEAPGKISLQPSRQLEKLDSVPNGEVIVRLVVENQGDPIASLSILDDIQPSIEVIQGHSQVECALGSGAQKELKYKIRSGKSLISWHSATFVAGDSLGCRIYHSTVASSIDPSVHCPHAGPNGDGICADDGAPDRTAGDRG